jgi:cold shock CspA family protein/ribosome-associated translation inhibitor RaiA
MIIPVQVTFKNIEPSNAVAARIEGEAAKLDTFYDRITSCRVVVEAPHRHHKWGVLYHITIELGVPGKEIVVRHEPTLRSALQHGETEKWHKQLEADAPHRDIYVSIRDAFKAARRQLQDYVRQQRGDVKTHAPPFHARVSRLFPLDGYGFLETVEGREVYFHRNSVLDDAFGRLAIGMEVTFAEERGEKGAQASTVRIASRRQPMAPVHCNKPV